MMFSSVMTYTNRLFEGLSLKKQDILESYRQEQTGIGLLDEAAREKPLSDVEFCVIDIELTGLNRKQDSPVSFGAIKMKGTSIFPGQIFYSLARPNSALTQSSILVHGIVPQEVEDAPEVEDVLSQFLEFIGNDIVVGHFVTIDRRFINKEMKRVVGGSMRNKCLDTAVLHTYLQRKSACPVRESDLIIQNNTLAHLSTECEIGPPRSAHNALADAYTTAQLFQRLLAKLKHRRVATLGELLAIGSV